jgi:glycosyltransferase
VAKQSYANIEHIIIDNCSTDGTLELAERFGHISRIISEKDKGIYDAMNKGIAHATGDIIGILNSDDYLASEQTIANIANEFNEEKTQAIYGNLIFVNNNKDHKIHRLWLVGGYNSKLFYNGWMLPHPTFYVRKQVYEKYGSYDDSFRYAADYEMILRLLLKNRIVVTPMREVLVYMLSGGAGNKNLKTRIKVNLEDRRAWRTVGLIPNWYTLYAKPLRKLWQFIRHYFSYRWLTHVPPAKDLTSYIHKKQRINVYESMSNNSSKP